MAARTASQSSLIRLGDVSLLVLLLGLWPIAWFLPERLWPGATGAILRVTQVSGKARARLALIQTALQDRSQTTRQINQDSTRNWLLRQMQLLRAYRPGGWHPKIAVEGRECIDTALAKGSGVILWTAPFCFHQFIPKIGLRDAGFRLTQLSVPTHGFSTTHFGVRVLNPQWTRIENRYLERRIVISDNWDQSKSDIRQVLRGNGLVMIAARKGAARRPATIRLLNARYPLGLGPAVLAYDSGAALIPVYTLHESADSYRVVIGPALPVRHDLARYDAALDAAQKLAVQLEQCIRAHPAQWNWWEMMGEASAEEAIHSPDIGLNRNDTTHLTATRS